MLNGTTCLGNSSCGRGFFGNKDTMMCEACPTGCLSCRSASVCLECKNQLPCVRGDQFFPTTLPRVKTREARRLSAKRRETGQM